MWADGVKAVSDKFESLEKTSKCTFQHEVKADAGRACRMWNKVC